MRTSVIVFALLAAFSCKEKDSSVKTEPTVPVVVMVKDAAPTAPADAHAQNATALSAVRDPENIKFALHPSLGKLNTPTVQPACIRGVAQKPDGAAPPALAYRFEGSTATKPCAFPDFESAGLYVFDRADFARTVPKAKEDLEKLERLLEQRPEQPNEIPFAPFVDATQAYVARTEYIDFEGGAGVLTFTEFSTEPDVLFKAPMYVFEGLSADGETYVLALFPVAVDISVPSFRWSKGDFAETTERHKLYAAKIAEDANNLRSKSIVPRPEAIARTVRSLVLNSLDDKNAAEE